MDFYQVQWFVYNILFDVAGYTLRYLIRFIIDLIYLLFFFLFVYSLYTFNAYLIELNVSLSCLFHRLMLFTVFIFFLSLYFFRTYQKVIKKSIITGTTAWEGVWGDYKLEIFFFLQSLQLNGWMNHHQDTVFSPQCWKHLHDNVQK